jgi:hypothetical protein
MKGGEIVAGRFAVEALAGEGGMGAVYRAIDRETGEKIALKVMRGRDAQGDARFENEALLLAGIAHPGVVRYVAHGVTEAGEPYLAMEWIDGEDLAARIVRAGLSLAESVAIARAIAEALAAAHAAGVVHRDLKPSNVMLAGGAVDRIKILDFGIARAGGADRAITQTGAVMGTPGYMAPEQVRSARDTDARADLFSLGALLFESLTGRPAFAGDHALAILAKLLLEEAPRARDLVPAVPAALDALVARLLAKDREGRPASAAAAAAELAAIEASLESGPRSALDVPRPAGGAAITGGEQRLLCVILAGRGVAPDTATAPTLMASAIDSARREIDRALSSQGARAEWLASGAVLVSLTGAGNAGDQAARAARCALVLRRHFPELCIALVTGRGDPAGALPVGAVIDRAAALLAGAPEGRGGVLLDEVTSSLLDVRFDVAAGPRGVELLDERAIGEETRTLLGRPSPCVGRDRELRALGDLVDECADEGVARAALITAPAGVGKSRLRSELVRRVRRQRPEAAIWAAGGDPINTASPFALLAAALRQAAEIRAGEPIEARRDKLAAFVAAKVGAAERARVTEFLGEMLGVPFADDASPRLYAARKSPAVMADQIRLAWLEIVAATTAAAPLLLVLEDLQWSDLPSIKLVDLALREHAERPLLVIALARPEVHDAFPRLWAERGLAEIRLGELTRRAAESLVRHALGASAGAAAVAAIVDRAAGNAFYLEELIRAVAEGRGDALPESVLAMVEARLLALSAEERRALRAASVFGEVFWGGAVAALLGGATVADSGPAALAALEALVDREIVVRRGAGAFPGEEEYAFRHALLREGAYAMLSDADRALGHRLAAAFLERAGEGDPLILAEHLERGGERARAAGYFRRAAEAALRGDDLDAAIARAERGLACGAAGDDALALLAARAEATSWKGDLDLADARAAEVIAQAPAGSGSWYWAHAGLAAHGFFRGRVDVLAETMARVVDLPPSAEGAAGFIAAAGSVMPLIFASGQIDLALRALDRMEAAEALCADPDPRTRGWLENARSVRAREVDGDAWAALVANSRARAAFEAAGDRQYLALIDQREADLLLQLGAPRRAIAAARRSLASPTATGLSVAATRALFIAALLEAGELDEAFAALRDARAGRAPRADLDALLALHHLYRGDLGEADRLASAAVAAATSGADRAAARACLGEIRVRQGRFDDALAAVRGALAKLRSRLHATSESRLLLAQAEALLGLRDPGALGALAAARDRVLAGAAKIGDPDLARAYVEDIRAHARTLALARDHLG